MRFKGVRWATLVATEFGTKLLTPPTCAKDHCPATGNSHNVGETPTSDLLAYEFGRARDMRTSPHGCQLRMIALNAASAAAVAQSIPGILTFATRTTMMNIGWRVKSDFWKTQFSAFSNGPFQEQEQ